MRPVLALIVLALLANLVSAPPLSSAAGPTLRIAMVSMPWTPDPTYDTAGHSLTTYRLIYDPLVNVQQGKQIPVLATSWRQNSDLEWIISIRRGVRFHDGTELSANDVKFTIERVIDPKMKAQLFARFAFVDRVEVLDRYTVRVVTKQPVPILMAQLSFLSILPAKLFDPAQPDRYLSQPVGSGPYQVVEWRSNERVTLKAFEGYWGKKPAIDTIVIRHMPEAATRVAALEAGEVDIAHFLPPEHARRLESKGFTTQWVSVGQIINVNLKNTMDSPLKDKRVRQAINYAIDKDAILQEVMLGYGRKLEGQITGPGAYGYNPNLKSYPYDLAKAKELLAEAGYRNGFSVHFDSVMARYPKDKEITEVIAAQLTKVGIRVDVAYLESSVWSRKYRDGTIGPMWMSGWMYSPGGDAELPLSQFLCESVYKTYCNRDFDALLAAASREINRTKRLEALQKLAALFREEAPMIFLHQIAVIYGISPKVTGIKFWDDFTMDVGGATVK